MEAAESTKSVLTPSLNPSGDTKSETLHASKSGPLHVRRETRDDPEFYEKLHKVEKLVTYYICKYEYIYVKVEQLVTQLRRENEAQKRELEHIKQSGDQVSVGQAPPWTNG